MPAVDFDELYRTCRPVVRHRAAQLVGDGEADEVVHEVFLLALEQMDAFRGAASPATWLYRVTTNHCLTRLRDSARRRRLLQRALDDGILARPALADAEARLALNELWDRLDPELAAVALYYHVDGMTQEAIADVMDTSRRTIGNRLATLRSMLGNAAEVQAR